MAALDAYTKAAIEVAKEENEEGGVIVIIGVIPRDDQDELENALDAIRCSGKARTFEVTPPAQNWRVKERL